MSARLAIPGIAAAWVTAVRALPPASGTFNQIAEREYLRNHARLPGSDRTSRMRKKRHARVWRWFVATPGPVHIAVDSPGGPL